MNRSRRGVFQGYANILFGAGAAYVPTHVAESGKLIISLGAPVGGLINDTLGWRWAFYLQVSLTEFRYGSVDTNKADPPTGHRRFSHIPKSRLHPPSNPRNSYTNETNTPTETSQDRFLRLFPLSRICRCFTPSCFV
jgi:MFS family permease